LARKAHGLSDYEHEIFVSPNGHEMFLPSVMKFAICSWCHVPVISAEADDVSCAGANRYLEREWFRWQGGKFDGRPVCTKCRDSWRTGKHG
jgi:hypothetical protein